jgi:uncharacterized protein with HEPN domain
VSRTDQERLNDMLLALDRCLRFRSHLDSDDNTMSDMALDATLRNLAVVGDAAKALSEQARALFPSTPWHSIAGLRNIVIHEYFRIDTKIILDVVDSEVVPLATALRNHLDSTAEHSPD